MAQSLGDAILELRTDDRKLRRGIRGAERDARGLERTFKRVGTAVVAAFSVRQVGRFAAAIVQAASQFESSFAGIRKTVDATEAQFAALSDGIRELSKDIPVGVNELNRIGEAAGQLGIQTQNIIEFTRTMADLGVTTNLSSDQAATALARLANITQLPQDQIDRLGSTIVDLGNNFATTEAEIVELGLRMAGAGEVAGLTEAQILGIGAALSSVGLEAESGGTAVQQALLTIDQAVATGNEDLEVFARTAGVSAEVFRKAWTEDAGAAFTSFIEGLGRQGKAAAVTLDEVGLGGVRTSRAFLSLANAGDVLSRSMQTGTQAFRENTALAEEAEKRYETFDSQAQLLKNAIEDLAITFGDELLKELRSTIEALREFADSDDARETAEELAETVADLAGAVSDLTGALRDLLEFSQPLADLLNLFGGAAPDPARLRRTAQLVEGIERFLLQSRAPETAIAGRIREMADELDEAARAAQTAENALDVLVMRNEAEFRIAQLTADELSRMGEEARRAGEAMDPGLTDPLDKVGDEAETAVERLLELDGSATEAAEAIDLVGERSRDATDSVVTFGDEIRQVSDDLRQLSDDVSRRVDAQNFLRGLSEQITDDVARALTNAILSGDVDNAIEGFGRALEAAAADALTRAISSALSGDAAAAGAASFASAFLAVAAVSLEAAFDDDEGRRLTGDVNIGIGGVTTPPDFENASRETREAFQALDDSITQAMASLQDTLRFVIPKTFEDVILEIQAQVVDGQRRFKVGFIDIDVREDRENFEATFETLEEATGFALREFTQALIAQGVEFDAAVTEFIQGFGEGMELNEIPFENFQAQLARVQELADVAAMSLDGVTQVELALQSIGPQAQALARELQGLGLSAAQTTRLVGGQIVQQLQSLRQQITGEELSLAMRKAIQKSNAQLFNAERALRIADLKTKRAALEAQLNLTRAEIELIRQGVKGYEQALRAKGEAYSAEVKLIVDQIKAINKILEALGNIPEINIGTLRLPGVPRVSVPRVPTGGGGGGAAGPSLAEQLASLLDRLFPEQRRAREFREQMQLLNRALGEGLITAQRYQQAVRALREEMTRGIRDALDSLREFRIGLQLNAASPLSFGRQLLVAQREFVRQQRVARQTGDVSGFRNAAQTLLDLARQGFGSGAGFQGIFRDILRATDSLEDDLGNKLDELLKPPAEQTALSTKEIAETSERIRANTVSTIAAVQDLEAETGLASEQNQVSHGKTQFEIREADKRMEKRIEAQTRAFVKAIERIRVA